MAEAGGIAAEYLATREEPPIPGASRTTFHIEDLRSRAVRLHAAAKVMLDQLPPFCSYEELSLSQCRNIIPRWLRGVLLDEAAPRVMHKYHNLTAYNIWSWMRWSMMRLLQVEVHISMTLAQGGQPNFVDSWVAELQGFVEDFCAGIGYAIMPFHESDEQSWESSDDVRGVKGHFMVRSIAGARLTMGFLRRLGVEMEEAQRWVEYVLQVVKFDVGIEPFRVEDPLDIPWLL